MTTRASKREEFLAVVTAAVIIGAVVFAGVIEPQLKRRGHVLSHMRKLQVRLTKMHVDLLMKDRIDADYARVEPLIAGTGTDLQEKAKFARELYGLLAGPNVQTRAVTPLPLKNEEFYRRLTVKVEMTGNIRDVLKFISAVETYRNPIRIERLDLKTREAVDDVQAALTITKVVAKADVGGQTDD